MAERHGDDKRDNAPIIVPQRDPSHVAPHEVASKRCKHIEDEGSESRRGLVST
jgi:hypothetical protein